MFTGLSKQHSHTYADLYKVAALILLLFTMLILSLSYGEIKLTPYDLWSVITGQSPSVHTLLIETIRLPRTLAAAMIGAALALSGLLLQLMTKNPLASPDVLGISDSAVLAMAASILLSNSVMMGSWWQALLGALICTGIVLIAAGQIGTQGYRILVVGIGIATLMKASFDLIISTLPIMHSSSVYIFSTGSLVGRGYSVLLPTSVLIGMLTLLMFAWRRLMTVMVLPDAVIESLGEPLPYLKLALTIIAALLAGTAVSIAGPIGFIAIAAPLLAHRLFPHQMFPLFGTLIIGALMVMGADLMGRTLLAPVEIPAGIISGVIGGPLLLWLLFSQSQRVQ